MIGYLRGRLVHKDPPQLLVEVAGVGYEVEAPTSTWAVLPEIGGEVQLRTQLVIREDQHLLFGFASEAERRLFRDLLKVSGVGARIALAILSGISVDGFVRCVQARDTAALTRLPGVGRKTAERLILDLRDRVEEMAAAGLAGIVTPADGPAARAEAEVVDALQALGYRPVEARRLVEQAQAAGATTTADILRAALKAAAPGGRS
ncbi:MAG: Holliday junction branch migration protein RuvA [Gammaproteobacteria bacterium]|nr:Holliday junction branch migration protein RuvA [Gammaproteobacteria bacterium]